MQTLSIKYKNLRFRIPEPTVRQVEQLLHIDAHQLSVSWWTRLRLLASGASPLTRLRLALFYIRHGDPAAAAIIQVIYQTLNPDAEARSSTRIGEPDYRAELDAFHRALYHSAATLHRTAEELRDMPVREFQRITEAVARQDHQRAQWEASLHDKKIQH